MKVITHPLKNVTIQIFGDLSLDLGQSEMDYVVVVDLFSV
jgi:hypothetical protein